MPCSSRYWSSSISGSTAVQTFGPTAACVAPSTWRAGKRTFAAVAKAVRPHRGSGHSSENQGGNLPDRHKGRIPDFRCSDDPIAQQRWTPTLSADQDRGFFCIAARRHRAQTEGCCKFTERQLRALIAAVRLVGGNPSSGHEIRWGTPLTYSTVRDSSRLRQIIVVTYLRRRRSSALRQHRSRTALPSSASRCGSSPYRRRFPHPAPACALQAFRLRALPDLARRRSS